VSPIERSNALHVLGVAAQMAGELQEARGFMTQRIELARELGDLALVGTESSNLSMVERQLGNLERAEQLATESLQLEARRGDEWAIPYTLNGPAAIAVETGAFERAATLLAAAATDRLTVLEGQPGPRRSRRSDPPSQPMPESS
jgi:hypothetical protein